MNKATQTQGFKQVIQNGYVFMMQYKHAIYALTLLSTSSIFANVPIETRGLSQNDSGSNYGSTSTNTPVAEASVPTNINWQLMQKNQQLENDIRSLDAINTRVIFLDVAKQNTDNGLAYTLFSNFLCKILFFLN